ncbi:MAG: hypothetical protein CM1200mP41_25500 [Gammaproteobacteria bacterium]|nr:MAG: hypothetical protein CM1200mP41_25500 [Gammaproteobacteria bacterium]
MMPSWAGGRNIGRCHGFYGEMVGKSDQCKVIDECLQLHGGYGYMMEYPIARSILMHAFRKSRWYQRNHERTDRAFHGFLNRFILQYGRGAI